jgi:hypothetical protein
MQHGLPMVAEIIPPPGQEKPEDFWHHAKNLAFKLGFGQPGHDKDKKTEAVRASESKHRT